MNAFKLSALAALTATMGFLGGMVMPWPINSWWIS